ncbi:hypothetical protein EDB89DRAFT_1438915 [Lactarius sanguifluus]|nr:hypothetical protein EDB89DRAFT_1438915 [Lactarius sanguifluus]
MYGFAGDMKGGVFLMPSVDTLHWTFLKGLDSEEGGHHWRRSNASTRVSIKVGISRCLRSCTDTRITDDMTSTLKICALKDSQMRQVRDSFHAYFCKCFWVLEASYSSRATGLASARSLWRRQKSSRDVLRPGPPTFCLSLEDVAAGPEMLKSYVYWSVPCTIGKPKGKLKESQNFKLAVGDLSPWSKSEH